MRTPSNSVAASIFFLASLVLDCLTAIDSSASADAPSSLRGASLVLVACLAAPLVKSNPAQRPVIAIGLVVAALYGLHHGGVETRTFDALYTTLVGLIVLWMFSSGGLDEAGKMSAKETIAKAVMKSSSTLAGALLFYASLRISRAGLEHSAEVSTFVVQLSSNSSNSSPSPPPSAGYAHSSSTASVSLTVGGVAGAAAAILVLFGHADLEIGTDALTVPLCTAAGIQLVCALAASLSYGEQVDTLTAVFGVTACRTSETVCSAAAAARRFAGANTPVCCLWVSAIGLLSLGFPPSTRLRETKQVFKWGWVAVLLGTLVFAAAIAVVVWKAAFSGKGGHTDFVMLAVLVGVYVSFFIGNVVGTLVSVVAMIVEEVIYLQYYGAATLFSHLTHLTLVATIVLLSLHVLLQIMTIWLRWYSLHLVSGVVATTGTSLAVGLYLASASLLAIANGNINELHDTDNGRWFAMSFVLHHFCPLLVWLPLIVCRCDFHLLTAWERMVVWIVALPMLLTLYAVCLAIINSTAPTASLIDETAFVGAVIGAGLLPWVMAGTV